MAWLVTGTVAHAQWQEPPTITVVEAERSVRVLAANESLNTNVVGTTSEAGPYVDFVADEIAGIWGSQSKAEAKQNTQISSFSIHGSGEIKVDETVGGAPEAHCGSQATSRVQVTFTVPVNAPFALTGIFEASATSGSPAEGSVSFIGFDENGSFFSLQKLFSATDPPDESGFFFTGTVKADTELHLLIFADGFCGGEEDVAVAASFDFALDFGDRDGDGLLDSWEEAEGINIDQDPDLEVKLDGADPDRKDLFVEVDVMAGVAFDEVAIAMVKRAFAQAPGDLVWNPIPRAATIDDPTINLHVIWDDGDAPGNVPLSAPPGVWPGQFGVIKDEYFGSPSDRPPIRTDWDTAGRPARAHVYRYCLWANTLNDGQELMGDAESPGNDFIVAAGGVSTWPSVANVITETLAGTFMHELGHNLGLDHGGQDELDLKPNYISVMNSAYGEPWDKITLQGTNAKEIWRLDYSRGAMATLDEERMQENQGLDGPLGRMILFNSAAAGEPSLLNFVWAVAPWVDWNFSDAVDGFPYPLDISRLSPGILEDTYDLLVSYPDWDRLWYQLSGTGHFNDGIVPGAEQTSPEMSEELIESILSADWVDQTVLGDLVFANDFELGSTTAWSATVP